MDNHISLRHVCSICLERFKKDTHSVEPAVDPKKVWEKLSWCFRITFNFEKEPPYSFCRQCLEALETSCRFRTKCMTINHEHFEEYCKKLSEITLLVNSEVEDREVLEDTESELEEDTISINEKETFICDLCNKVLTKKKSLLKHIVSMHEKRDHPGKVTGFGGSRQYHCTSCPYKTPHSQTLINHMRRHNGERPFKCECGKSFTQTSSLAAHLKIHSSTTYYTCTKCGKQFKHAFSLKTHMKVHSNGTFSCHICTKVLKSKRTLTSHLNRHYKIYNFNCEDCGNTFVTSAELLNHKNKHRTKKNIVCHFCDYATNSKKNLIAHLKRYTAKTVCYRLEQKEINKILSSFFPDMKVKKLASACSVKRPFSRMETYGGIYASTLVKNLLYATYAHRDLHIVQV